MGIGLKLDTLMKERGTNANELANKVGIAPTTIYSMIKRDSKKADIEVLIKISRELGVEPEYFCDDSIPLKKPTYEDTKRLIARNGKELTTEQRMELIKLLSEI
ncbi:helix-turn-helix domain-containing protein [[Clostridium] symbiosum]|uniref:helix-turn-helix domain-containing protein n=1 Tax=Clostridium symbiosum TaxID=1512 RepID=UPI00189F7786|nr:helix-turn-helix transcriptional regulator [[Clostridium] symbiosum]